MTKDVVILLALTFLSVLAWIGFEVYHSKTTLTVPKIVSEISEPITPKIDTETIEKLKLRH